MCLVAICKAARLGLYAAISQTRFSLRRWTIGPLPVSLYHRWTPWSPIKQKRNDYRDSFARLVHGSCVTFRGSALSEGVSADDWGGWGEGPRRCMGYLWMFLCFASFGARVIRHVDGGPEGRRSGRARGTEGRRGGMTEGPRDGGATFVLISF